MKLPPVKLLLGESLRSGEPSRASLGRVRVRVKVRIRVRVEW